MDINAKWGKEIPENDFVSKAPTYKAGIYLNLFDEDFFKTGELSNGDGMKYYFYDPARNGYPVKEDYPLLIFLHGATNALVGKTCVNYTAAELYASPDYQKDFGGAYILVPLANEYKDEDDNLHGYWDYEYAKPIIDLIDEFVEKHTKGIGKKFLFGSSSGGRMAFIMGNKYADHFDVIGPISSDFIPDDTTLDYYEECGTIFFFATGMRDELVDFEGKIAPRLEKMRSLTNSLIYTPDWVRNGDGGIASIDFGFEMGQHCLCNSFHANLMFDNGKPMSELLPHGVTGWIDMINKM